MRNLSIAAAFALLVGLAQVFTGHPASAAPATKPLVVRVEAGWCPACRATQTTFDKIQREYAGKVQFVVLDVTDAQTAHLSETRARRLGILDFYNQFRDATSTVAVIDPRSHAVLGSVYNDTNPGDYERLINTAIQSR